MLGRRQVVRHRFLVPAFGGSNPPAPAKLFRQVAADNFRPADLTIAIKVLSVGFP